MQPATVPIFGIEKVIANLQLAHRHLALDRREQAGHRRLHVVERVVDDVVQPDLDALLLGVLAALARRADVKPTMIAPPALARLTSLS